MSTVIRNVGSRELGLEQNQTKAFTGTSRFVFENQEYVCGPNATVTLVDRVATAWLANDSKMEFVSRS